MKNQVLVIVKKSLGSKGCKPQKDVYDILESKLNLTRKQISAHINKLIKEKQLVTVVEDKVKYIELFDLDGAGVVAEVVKPEVEKPNMKQSNVYLKTKMEKNIGQKCNFTQRGGIKGSGVISGLTINKTKTIYYYLVKVADGKKKCVKSENITL